MPYKSDAQRRFFHTKAARKAGISEATVKEYDDASRGKKLPEHAKAGNTSYLVVPATKPDGSLDPIQDTKDGINAPEPTSTFQEIAGTNTSQVQSTPVTAYRGSAKF